MRLSGGGGVYPFWRLGFRQFSFGHITRVFPALRPYASARPLVCWHAIVPFTFRILSKPSDPGISSKFLPAKPGIQQGASRRSHVRQFTIIGDGAAWIWNIATGKFPEATQIVDLFHAREHLHDLARQLEFMLLDHKDDWLAARLEDLDYGDLNGICAAARVFPLEGTKKDELDTALGYFENNAPRMRYKWFRQCGLFVGSGVVEAGCKSVIGQRLKQAGMHWTTDGADAIIALRCREASSTWEAICNTPHTQTRTA